MSVFAAAQRARFRIAAVIARFHNTWRATSKTQRNLRRQPAQATRRLEIGPGKERLPEFETLNIIDGPHVDYVWDAARPLPFADNTFHLIYASHILEHLPWYHTIRVLEQWVRTLRPGGRLEVWVPDGLKICEAFVDAEKGSENRIALDGWYRFNPERDTCKWAAGRLFTYGDGSGAIDAPNWHRAIFSARYLKECLVKAGLREVSQLDRSQVRGADHGWINLGMTGKK